jgi:hypothetical protein
VRLVSAQPSPATPPPPALGASSPQSEKDARQQKTRRRHQGEIAEGDERDATLDLFLKHPDTTLVTYVWRYMKHLKHVSDLNT